ncbi:MAG: hypothetical protein IPL59_12540 [Candidatus Competibacteraceae bacterium]|nr:hypothetical protein [Candidatus Competibacteraceae bacterium]
MEYIQNGIKRLGRIAGYISEFVCASDYLAKVIQNIFSTEKKISVIGDLIETEPFYLVSDSSILRLFSPTRWKAQFDFYRFYFKIGLERKHGRSLLVWFGNHGTQYAEGGMNDLLSVRDIIGSINQIHPVSLSIISNNESKFNLLAQEWPTPIHFLWWNRITFLSALRQHDIAIIPIKPNPFTLSKSNNRLTLALSQSVACIADPIPSYVEFRECSYIGNWKDGLTNYLTNPELRMKHLTISKKILTENYSTDVIVGLWEKLIQRYTGTS